MTLARGASKQDSSLDDLYAVARKQFAYFDPARKNAAFMENAGGSQVIAVDMFHCALARILQHRQRASVRQVTVYQHASLMHVSRGPQVPICVADAVRDHLLYNCAQLGAGYATSNRSDAAVDAGHEVVRVRCSFNSGQLVPPAAGALSWCHRAAQQLP